jgi:hypothetical protein
MYLFKSCARGPPCWPSHALSKSERVNERSLFISLKCIYFYIYIKATPVACRRGGATPHFVSVASPALPPGAAKPPYQSRLLCIYYAGAHQKLLFGALVTHAHADSPFVFYRGSPKNVGKSQIISLMPLCCGGGVAEFDHEIPQQLRSFGQLLPFPKLQVKSEKYMSNEQSI